MGRQPQSPPALFSESEFEGRLAKAWAKAQAEPDITNEPLHDENGNFDLVEHCRRELRRKAAAPRDSAGARDLEAELRDLVEDIEIDTTTLEGWRTLALFSLVESRPGFRLEHGIKASPGSKLSKIELRNRKFLEFYDRVKNERAAHERLIEWRRAYNSNSDIDASLDEPANKKDIQRELDALHQMRKLVTRGEKEDPRIDSSLKIAIAAACHFQSLQDIARRLSRHV